MSCLLTEGTCCSARHGLPFGLPAVAHLPRKICRDGETHALIGRLRLLAAAQVLRRALAAAEVGPRKQRFLLEQLGGQVGHSA